MLNRVILISHRATRPRRVSAFDGAWPSQRGHARGQGTGHPGGVQLVHLRHELETRVVREEAFSVAGVDGRLNTFRYRYIRIMFESGMFVLLRRTLWSTDPSLYTAGLDLEESK